MPHKPPEALIRHGRVRAYTIPTDAPEADGTIAWNQTTIVIVELDAGTHTGLGYTYADLATAKLAQHLLDTVVVGKHDALDNSAVWHACVQRIRNLGRPGIASMAISAIDNAGWDLKAKLLGLPLVKLLGQLRDGVEVYGSGGFTSYSLKQLAQQLGGWAEQGMHAVKMKIGADPDRDLHRVRVAREAIGPDVQLFVDANGAYSVKQALLFADAFANYNVRWFEEPVSSDDLPGLRFIREHAPPLMDIAAGEYGYDQYYFARMLDAQAVDVQQADATRCAGITGFIAAEALCAAHNTPISAHCAPTLHAHPCCALARVRNVEYFHDHQRIEQMFFDGFSVPRDGKLYPDLSRPGMGIELKMQDAKRYAA